MNESHMLLAMQQMLYYTLVGVCILTLPILIVGVVISVFQAATQINEMTITFIPKLIVVLSLLFVLSPWLMHNLSVITTHYLTHLPEYIR